MVHSQTFVLLDYLILFQHISQMTMMLTLVMVLFLVISFLSIFWPLSYIQQIHLQYDMGECNILRLHYLLDMTHILSGQIVFSFYRVRILLLILEVMSIYQ